MSTYCWKLRDHGRVWGHLIEHGGGLTDAIVFGRIAGEHAAARSTGG